MKNKFVFSVSLAVLFISVLGCSFYNPLEGSSNSAGGDNRNLSDKTIDATIGESKIGVPECDEIFNFFADQAKSPDDDFVTRAAREYALNKIRERLKQSIAEHQGDTAAMARECRKFKTELDKFKAQENNQNAAKK
jgi:hypothetical protein